MLIRPDFQIPNKIDYQLSSLDFMQMKVQARNEYVSV